MMKMMMVHAGSPILHPAGLAGNQQQNASKSGNPLEPIL